MPQQQVNLTRGRALNAANGAPVQPINGAPSEPHIVLSPRTPTGQLTTGFLFASTNADPQVGVVVWKQETASGFWFKLLSVLPADAWAGEWITVCEVNATPLYFQAASDGAPVQIFVEELGSSPG